MTVDNDDEIFQRKLRRKFTLYTCICKGGIYTIISKSKGAGTIRGQDLVIYKCLTSGQTYHRTQEDFDTRMEVLE